MKITSRPPSAEPSATRRTWFVCLLAGPALALALAGCTPSGSPGAAPNPSQGTSAAQPGTDAEFSAARDAYDRKLAECLRGQGLDVKDPLPGKGITEDGPDVRAAYPTCAAEIGDPPSSAGLQISPEDLAKLLERASCLRGKGYDIQEPTSTDPGFIPAEVSADDFTQCEIA